MKSAGDIFSVEQGAFRFFFVALFCYCLCFIHAPYAHSLEKSFGLSVGVNDNVDVSQDKTASSFLQYQVNMTRKSINESSISKNSTFFGGGYLYGLF